jgi:hypothetical protein
LLPQANDVHPHESNVKQISECDNVLIDEIFDNNAVFVRFRLEMLLKFGESLGKGAVDGFVEDVCYQHVH